MYRLFIACITVLTISLPWLAPWCAARSGRKVYSPPVWLPFAAACLYVLSGLLPDIHISPETTTFQEHFVGGGMYTAILFIYFTKLFGWKTHWFLTLLALYAWTSSLGVANELLEFSLTKLNITHIDITDTSWDITANTLGSLFVFLLWQFWNRMHSGAKQR